MTFFPDDPSDDSPSTVSSDADSLPSTPSDAESASDESSENPASPPTVSEATHSGRLLNKEELDHLLAGAASEENKALVGLEMLLNSGRVSHERLPMLEVVIDRLVRHLGTSLRNFTNTNVTVTLEDITSTRFGMYLETLTPPNLVGVFDIEEWEDSQGILVANQSLIYCLLDILLGARKGDGALDHGERPYTTIEQGLIEKFHSLVLKDFSTSFEPIRPVHFHFQRLESNPAFVSIVRPVNAVILVRVMIKVDNRGGRLEFVLPYSSLEPIRNQLLQMVMGEKFGQDPMWERHFAGELWEARIPLQAVLKTFTCSLEDVLKWGIGTQLMLDVKPETPVSLKCGDLVIGQGRMGQRHKHIAVQMEKSFIKEKKPS